MKKPVLLFVCLLAGLVAGSIHAGNGNGWGNGPGNGRGDTAPPGAQLSDAEKQDLQCIREEEKLARDTYLAMLDVWSMPIFANIAASEQNHMDAMMAMIDLYGLEDPVGLNDIGEFTDQTIQDLYWELVGQGSLSLEDAYWVGVAIETRDITDLQAAIDATTKDPLLRSYGNLLEGSLRHLDAFNAQLGWSTGATVTGDLPAGEMPNPGIGCRWPDAFDRPR